MLAHKGCSFTDLRNRRIRERVEKVVLCQDEGPLDTLWIDVLIRLEWLLKFAIRRC